MPGVCRFPGAQTFEKKVTCGQAHPGLCRERDSALWPELMTFVKALKDSGLKLHKEAGGGQWQVICRKAQGSQLDDIYVCMMYGRKRSPKEVLYVLADAGEKLCLELDQDNPCKSFATTSTLAANVFQVTDNARVEIESVWIKPVKVGEFGSYSSVENLGVGDEAGTLFDRGIWVRKRKLRAAKTKDAASSTVDDKLKAMYQGLQGLAKPKKTRKRPTGGVKSMRPKAGAATAKKVRSLLKVKKHFGKKGKLTGRRQSKVTRGRRKQSDRKGYANAAEGDDDVEGDGEEPEGEGDEPEGESDEPPKEDDDEEEEYETKGTKTIGSEHSSSSTDSDESRSGKEDGLCREVAMSAGPKAKAKKLKKVRTAKAKPKAKPQTLSRIDKVLAQMEKLSAAPAASAKSAATSSATSSGSPRTATPLDNSLRSGEPEWWLTRSNVKGTCKGCKCVINATDFRLIFVPSSATSWRYASGGNRHWQYYHVAADCMRAGGAPRLRNTEDLIVDIANLSAAHKESDDAKKLKTASAQDAAVRAFAEL